MSIKLVIDRKQIAANLQAYGELDVASEVLALSDTRYETLSEIGGQLALDGRNLAEAACLAAVRVVEGVERPLLKKRRNWSLVDPKLLEPDPILLEVKQWFARYAGGEPISTAELVECVSAALAPLLPDFKYFKSKRYFRRKTAFGFQQVAIEPLRTGVSFNFGVRHEAIEIVENKICRETPTAATAGLQTISYRSYSMGPNNRYWKYRINPEWPIGGRDGLTLALPEMERFIEEIVLPYLEEHADVERVRQTFLEQPGHASQQAFAATVFAIDLLTGRADQLETDYQCIKHSFANFPPSMQQKFVEYLERAKELSASTDYLDN